MNSKGFTLIEIMIVVAIVAILAAIAVPSYQDSIRKANRTDAKEGLMAAATLQEKFFFQHNRYSSVIGEIGGANTKENFYTIQVAKHNDCSSDADTALTCYLLTATAKTGTVQAKDNLCYKLTLDYLGRRSAVDAEGNTSQNCW